MAAVNIPDGVSDDFDYEHWAPIVKTRLVENGVWDVVDNGVSPDPTKIPELAATIKVVDLAQWRNRVIKDNKALKIMQSSLPDSVFRKTISVASAKDLWDLLKKGNDDEEAKLRRLEKQFGKLMMYEGEPMDFYLERVLEIVDRFRSSGNAKSDDQVIAKLLTSLSLSYDDAIPVLEELMNLPDMTLHDLIEVFDLFGSHPETMPHMLKDFIKSLGKAKSEQMWCGVCKKYNHNQEDCYDNPRARVVNLSGASQFRGQCFQCGGRGHVDDSQKRIQKPEHLVTFGEEAMWRIVNCHSSHLTPYEKFFTTLDRLFRSRIFLSDGKFIMVKGKGDVMIMTKEGKERLKNVFFVPEINGNMLSLVGLMADNGCSVTFEGGKCIIQDQTGKVFGEAMSGKGGYAMRLQVIKEDIW